MIFAEHLQALATLLPRAVAEMGGPVTAASHVVADAVLSGRKVLSFGNGGSAEQAQHLAAELVVRYRDDRRALAGISLTADAAILTACGNDYSFDELFARQVAALGSPGDVAFALSTSGRSPNVLRGLAAARERGLSTILLTGEKGRAEAAKWDVGIVVPHLETAHVQELHLAAIHAVCRYVEERVAAGG
jgi:D-sedoheptulose 7-phosphate isomerase